MSAVQVSSINYTSVWEIVVEGGRAEQLCPLIGCGSCDGLRPTLSTFSFILFVFTAYGVSQDANKRFNLKASSLIERQSRVLSLSTMGALDSASRLSLV